MKLNTQSLWRKWQFPLLVLSAIGPVFPSLFCYILPQKWAMSWVFAAIFLVLACFGMVLERKYRKAYGWIGAALTLLLGFLLLPKPQSGVDAVAYLAPLTYGLLLPAVLPLAELPQTKEPHSEAKCQNRSSARHSEKVS